LIQKEYNTLQKEFNELKNKYNELQNDYSENTIIMSMKSMKQIYESQQVEIKNLKNTLYEIREQNKTVKLLINTIIKNSRQYKDTLALETRLEFIKEVLPSGYF
jgi:predicted nuclease with TOPRIM domain